MVVKEFYEQRKDGVKLYRSYSDKGFKIQKVETGAIYDEAIDVEGAPCSYIETSEVVDNGDSDAS